MSDVIDWNKYIEQKRVYIKGRYGYFIFDKRKATPRDGDYYSCDKCGATILKGEYYWTNRFDAEAMKERRIIGVRFSKVNDWHTYKICDKCYMKFD